MRRILPFLLALLPVAAHALPAQSVRLYGDNGDGVFKDVFVSSNHLKVEIAGITTGDDGAPGSEAYLPVEIYDMQEGKEAQITPLKEIMVAQR